MGGPPGMILLTFSYGYGCNQPALTTVTKLMEALLVWRVESTQKLRQPIRDRIELFN